MGTKSERNSALRYHYRMGNIFTSTRLEITEVDKAVLSLKTQRKRLEEFRSKTAAQVDSETVKASEHLTKNRKDLAVLALKRRKIQHKVLSKIDGWLISVEGVLTNLELTRNQGQSLSALKQGSEALKKLQRDIKLHDIMSLRQEMGEAEEYFKEVQAVIGESWTSADDIDIASSLEMLQAELEIEETAKLPSVPKHSEDVTDLMAALPTVPASKPERTPSRSHAIEA